ncbi:MAG: hypothetical protein Fur0037_14310 [Planctomycetota bacterium]
MLSRVAALLLAAFEIACGGFSGGGSQPPPPQNPIDLPLLAPGQRVGVVYSQPPASARAAMDAAWKECLASGADTYELAAAWTDVETAPGVIDTSFVGGLLTTTQSAGLAPYLVIKTIDQSVLDLPPDLVDAAHPAELGPGIRFDSAAVKARFAAVLDALVPLLVSRGGFYLSVGNEIDAYLGARPQQAAAFAAFVQAARDRARSIEPRLAVGATVTFSAIANEPGLVALLAAASDILAFTYYPLRPDFSPYPPGVAAADFAAMRAAAAPGPLLIQEVGYPAGPAARPTAARTNCSASSSPTSSPSCAPIRRSASVPSSSLAIGGRPPSTFSRATTASSIRSSGNTSARSACASTPTATPNPPTRSCSRACGAFERARGRRELRRKA